MKKTIAILIALMLCLSCLSLTAYAAEDSESIFLLLWVIFANRLFEFLSDMPGILVVFLLPPQFIRMQNSLMCESSFAFFPSLSSQIHGPCDSKTVNFQNHLLFIKNEYEVNMKADTPRGIRFHVYKPSRLFFFAVNSSSVIIPASISSFRRRISSM